MIRLYDFDEVRPEEILNRDIRAEADVEATVDAIIADVRARGDAARHTDFIIPNFSRRRHPGGQ